MNNIFNESKKEDYNLKLINNGVEAEAYLKKIIKDKIVDSLDLIILDVKLLELDGNHLLTLLKTNEETMEIPVLIFNNSNLKQDIINSYRLQANCCLSKPVALKDYVNTIRSIKSFWMDSEIVCLPSKF